MIRRIITLAIATVVVSMSACDSGGATTEADTFVAEDTTDSDTAEPMDTSTVEADTVVAVDTAEPVYDYPEGPYGGHYLDIIPPDLGFYEPWQEDWVYLRDFYGDPSVKVIVISSAAGWCTACMYEAWDLVETYDLYEDDGLAIIYTLYEDAEGQPLWKDHSRREADMALMVDWRDNAGVYVGLPRRVIDYPLYMDIGHQLGPYFDEEATPLTLIVRTSDMRVVFSAIGYNSGSITDNVKTFLFAQ